MELEEGPRTIADMVEALDWCGNSPKEVKAAMSRLVEVRMIEPVPTANSRKGFQPPRLCVGGVRDRVPRMDDFCELVVAVCADFAVDEALERPDRICFPSHDSGRELRRPAAQHDADEVSGRQHSAALLPENP